MGPRLKTFSLDDATLEIVLTKPNQSQWIRTLILEEDDLPRADLRARCDSHWESLRIAAAVIRQLYKHGGIQSTMLVDALAMDEHAQALFDDMDDRGHGVDFIIGQLRILAAAERVGGDLLAWQQPQ